MPSARQQSTPGAWTGSFFVNGAVAGDTLVIHIKRIWLNRDTAIYKNQLEENTLDPRGTAGCAIMVQTLPT
jgi:hypothetical protein